MVMTAVVALAASLSAGSVSGQVLVVAQQDLGFGELTPGAPMTVTPLDVMRRAHFTLQAQGRYHVTFDLPTHLSTVAGDRFPVQFGGSDGRVEIRNKVLTFDPTQGTELRINPAEQEASIFLGGRALPAPGQLAGNYTATIVMIIVQTGN